MLTRTQLLSYVTTKAKNNVKQKWWSNVTITKLEFAYCTVQQMFNHNKHFKSISLWQMNSIKFSRT